MTAGAPWSVKGIDPKAREIAKDLARRSGLTLGEWLNQVILDDEAPVEEAHRHPTFGRQASQAYRRFEASQRPIEGALRVSDALERLSARIEAAEQRSASAIGGIEQSVGHLMARFEQTEQDQLSIAGRFKGAVDSLRAEQARGRIEQEGSDSRVGDALKSIEGALSRVAGQLSEGEGRALETFGGLRQELDGVHERLEATFNDEAAGDLVESVIARLSSRLEQAELHTTNALHSLEAAFASLDARIKATEARVEDGEEGGRGQAQRLDALAASLTERIDAVRAEMAENIRASAADSRFDQVNQALRQINGHVRAAEQRSAGAIEKMGHEVLRMADVMARNVRDSERRSAEAIDRVGGEVARIADTVDQRLTQADAVGAQALERLGGEITRITERLTERIASAERRSAQAIDEVGDQVTRATERLNDRHERVSIELSERIRQSEDRTARYLDEARERIDQRLSETQRRTDETSTPTHEPLSYAAYADPAVAPFGDDSFAAPPTGFAEAPAPVFDHADPAHADAEPVEAEAFGAEDDFISPARFDRARQEFGDGPFAEPDGRQALVGGDDDWRVPQDDSHVEDFALDEASGQFGRAALAPPEDAEYGLEPPIDNSFDAEDEYFEAAPERPKTTRELIDQARMAARTAALSQDDQSGQGRGGSLIGGLGFGGARKKRHGSTMRTALLVSGGAAALGVTLAGYVILADKPHGALPGRIAETMGARNSTGARLGAGEVASNPLAAVALAPKPIPSQMAEAGQPMVPAAEAAGGAELYNDAIHRIEAKDKTGVAVLRKAANVGYAPAQFYLAKLFEEGQAGLPKDLVEARRWTERAAEGGDRKAMHNLALYYFEGAGGPKNLISAAQWFHRAADLGLVDSQYNLARLYEEGFGVGQNPAEAYKWYLIAGRTGDADSRLSALRIKSELSAEAQGAAERAAQGFQAQAPQAIGPAVAGAAGGDAAGVAAAQRALSSLGFYRGPSDGAASPALNLAIAAYQRGQGLPATGQLDPSLSQRLATALQ